MSSDPAAGQSSGDRNQLPSHEARLQPDPSRAADISPEGASRLTSALLFPEDCPLAMSSGPAAGQSSGDRNELPSHEARLQPDPAGRPGSRTRAPHDSRVRCCSPRTARSPRAPIRPPGSPQETATNSRVMRHAHSRIPAARPGSRTRAPHDSRFWCCPPRTARSPRAPAPPPGSPQETAINSRAVSHPYRRIPYHVPSTPSASSSCLRNPRHIRRTAVVSAVSATYASRPTTPRSRPSSSR